MDQPNETQNQSQPQTQAPPPVQPVAPVPPAQGPSPVLPASSPAAPSPKKSNAWIWILGGCLGILILAGIAVVALGWWGARKAKRELEKFQPGLEQVKENADKWNKESEEWQKKAEEFRNNMPNPNDLQNQIPPTNPPAAPQ